MVNKLVKILYILIPLVVLLIFLMDLLSFYSNIVIGDISFLRELVIFSLIFICYYYIKSRAHFDELTIQQNLAWLSIIIAVNIALSIIFNLFFSPEYSVGFPPSYNSPNAVVVSTLTAIIASFTLVPALFILKQLIFYKRKRNTAIIFNLYLAAITMNAISVFWTRQPISDLNFTSQTLGNDLSFSASLIFIIILSF
ncbi:MAG: hypothetical protein JXL67_07670, partial [Calditrichaeota bacterium]|nr:hypothetical protein [Calditrichota bacterium]